LLANDIGAQQHRAGCRRDLAGQSAREHALACSGTPADRDQAGFRRRDQLQREIEVSPCIGEAGGIMRIEVVLGA
jgi:hypothetical protein